MNKMCSMRHKAAYILCITAWPFYVLRKRFAIPLKFAEQAFTTIVVPDGRNEKIGI